MLAHQKKAQIGLSWSFVIVEMCFPGVGDDDGPPLGGEEDFESLMLDSESILLGFFLVSVLLDLFLWVGEYSYTLVPVTVLMGSTVSDWSP